MNDETQEFIDAMNEHSKNIGTVAFHIKYAAIPGNREIHKQFADFCYKHANNNYLNGISILLKYKTIFDWLERIEDRIYEVETKTEGLRDLIMQKPKEEKNKEPKLF